MEAARWVGAPCYAGTWDGVCGCAFSYLHLSETGIITALDEQGIPRDIGRDERVLKVAPTAWMLERGPAGGEGWRCWIGGTGKTRDDACIIHLGQGGRQSLQDTMSCVRPKMA